MIDRFCDFVDRKTSELFLAVFLLIGIFGMSQFDSFSSLFYQLLEWLSDSTL